MTWAQKHNINHILIEPGSPTQNAYTDNFNGTFKNIRLDENWFESLKQARQTIATRPMCVFTSTVTIQP